MLGNLFKKGANRIDLETMHLKKRVNILSRNQRSLYQILNRITSKDYLVFPNYPLSWLVLVDGKEFDSAEDVDGDPFQGILLDMVIVSATNMRPECAIRVDRNAMDVSKLNEYTTLIAKAMAQIDLPMFVVPNLKQFNTSALAKKLKKILPDGAVFDTDELLNDAKQRLKTDENNRNDAWNNNLRR